ncbi:hypothetical protein HBI65_226400 [Parastagonospora nodorum]|nr:hypothetical protein HBI65_226400 [Parastagonospora nodorum]
MTERSRASNARDFVYQTSGQAGEASRQHAPYGSYDGGHDANGHVSANGMPEGMHDAALRYQAYGVHDQQQVPGQFTGTGYGYNNSMPLGWDWTNSIDFSDFTAQYEPQGELVEELQHPVTANDFNIPLPFATTDANFDPTAHAPAITTPNPLLTHHTISHAPEAPPQRPVVQTGMKRKANSEPDSAVSQTASNATETQHNPSKRQNRSRRSSSTSSPLPDVAESADARQSPATQASVVQPSSEPAPQVDTEPRKKEQSKGTGPQGRVIDVSKPRRVAESPGGMELLPAGKVFPIQIGSELFRLSGASITSDAPSYFSHFFSEQLHNNGGRAGDVKTLYIDRDPDTFREIALHLQGYHITPKDGEQFVKLFADAQFYSLPRLTKQLFKTDIFIRIGGTPFQIPRDLFSSPGDSPNYFSLGFAQFLSTPSDTFPGLDRSALLRPPSISPPSAPGRSGETFAEVIRILQGYAPEIRNEVHRSQLLRDARYFHLKGLEQKLIPCEISYNLKRQESEILMRLEDIRQSGVSFVPDESLSDSESVSPSAAPSISFPSARPGLVSYARPYTDDHSQTNILVLEISNGESTTLHLSPSAQTSTTINPRATFHNSTLARITSLFSVIASKMGLPATQPLGLMYLQTGSGVAAQPVSPANSGVSEGRVRVRLDKDCAFSLDGEAAEISTDETSRRVGVRRERDATWVWGGARDGEETEWIVKRAHWRLRVEPVEFDGETRMQVVLCGVKVEVFSVERRRNVSRGFLGSS